MTARKRSPPIRDPYVPRRRIIWRKVTIYSAVYKNRQGKVIVVRRTLQPPPQTRLFTGKGGLQKYTLTHTRRATREVIIMAKAAKKTKPETEEIDDDELDELAALEGLDDLDEDEDEDEDDTDTDEDDEDDDDDEDEAPKKKGKSSKSKSTKPKKVVEKDYVGSAEVAEHFGVDTRTLRMVFRKHEIQKDPDSNQYRWKSLNDPVVKKIGKLLKAGAADDIKKESLEKLKTQQAEKKAAAKAAKESGKGKKGKKNKKKVIEDDDDE